MQQSECSHCCGPIRHCSWCGAHVPRAQLVEGRCSLRCERAYRLAEIDRGPLRAELDACERQVAAAHDAEAWFRGAATAEDTRQIESARNRATNARNEARAAYRAAQSRVVTVRSRH